MSLLFDVEKAEHEMVILLGQTGGGKSSIANALIGKKLFGESSSLKSETDKLQMVNGKFFGKGTPVSVIDTPGFLDSEKRSADFLTEIIAIMKDFPKDKLKLVIITLPLSENRANSSYQTTIDEIELILGDNFLEHTIFVTTCQNQVKDPQLAQQRKNEWRQWLKTHAEVEDENIRMCNFMYDDPSSLSMIEDAFKQFSTFNPATSEKVHAYMKANPHATVEETIENIEEFNKLKKDFEDRLNEMIKEKEETIKKFQKQEALSQRMQKRLDTTLQEVDQLKKELADRPKEIIREIHHHHCCFPNTANVNKEGHKNPVSITSIKEGDRLLSVNSENEIVYSEVYFFYGKEVQGDFINIFFSTSQGEENIQLTADHVIFVSNQNDIQDGISGAFSLTSENVIPKEHYVWVKDASGAMCPKQVSKVEITQNEGLYTVLVKDHRLLVDNVVVSAYEISHKWGIIDTIPMRFLYSISPSFVASSFNKKFCELYDRVVEGCIKSIRSIFRRFW